MAALDELTWLDATAQAELVRKKEVRPAELVGAAIARIERVNPQLNAVIFPLYDEARNRADSELPAGPFTGVPFLLKNIFAWYAGAPHDQGSAFLKGFVAPHDSELVRRYKRAGLVVLGITNAPEYGILPTTEPQLHGPSRNPWNTNYTTGGSSGGSAAAVAAGLVPFAHANDGGGSIRIPAACCGLVGLKPTRARNPLGPDLGDAFSGFIAEHAVTRSVRDSAALLDATGGPDVGDPYCAPAPARPFIQEVGADPGRLRIAFTTVTPTGAPLHPDCVAAVKDAAKLCADLGHEVVEAAPVVNPEMITPMFMTVWSAGMAWTIDGFARALGRTPTPDQFEPGTWALYQMGQQQSAANYLFAIQWAQRLSRDIARFMLDYDVWLTPTLGAPPLPLGSMDSTPDNPMAGMRVAAQFVPFTPLCNVTGQPAISLPLYWNEQSLPVGTHFVGRFGDEATLFRLSAQLEAARPWAHRRPPVSA
ncbi:MAG TPA: amidase family protein [Blastocatellia bacterium]|nr:amidase family protein [Blastocatellia bacterium]